MSLPEQELVVDLEFLETIIKDKNILANYLTICNSPEQIDMISQFIIEHTERPGRVQELRRQKAEKEAGRLMSPREMRQESARTKKVGRTLSAEKIPPHLAKAHGHGTTSASSESPLASPHVPEREPKTHVLITAPTQPKIALEPTQPSLDASVHKPTGVAIPKLILKTAPAPTEKKTPKLSLNLNLGSLNENVDFEVSKEDLDFLRENQPMTPTRAKLEREAKKMALQANREARVLSARGEKPKEAFSPRVHLTEEVMNKKLRELDVAIKVASTEGSLTTFKIKSLKPVHVVGKERQRLVAELLASEEHYLANLTLVNEHVLKPLLAQKALEGEVQRIFTTYSDLALHHKAFIADLKALLAKWDVAPVLGEMLTKHLPLFRCYEDFPHDLAGRCQMAIARTRQQHANLDNLMKEFEKTLIEQHEEASSTTSGDKSDEAKESGPATITSLLHAPFQRLDYYVGVFQSLDKETPAGHADGAALKQHVTSLVTLANEINTAINVAQVDDINKQSELILAIDGGEHLMLVERKLLKEGGMELRELASSTRDLVANHFYYFFLFNDILVCCSLKKNLGEKQFQHHATIPLTDIQSISSNSDTHITIQFSSSESWVLENRKVKEKDSWQNILTSSCQK